MKHSTRIVLAAAATLLIFGESATIAEAQQFYNPWTFHRTRQQYSNRAATRSIHKTRAKRKVKARRKVARKTIRSTKAVRR